MCHPAPLLTAFCCWDGILRGDERATFLMQARALLGLATHFHEFVRGLSMLQPRCGAIMHDKKSAMLRSGPRPEKS